MSTYAQERETEQIIGVVTGIVQKGPDKWQAVVMPDGSQYTKNLWTKDQQLVGTLSTMIGQRMAFLCNASHWTNQQNQPVRSLWIDQVGPPAVGSPAMAGPPQTAMGYQPVQETVGQGGQYAQTAPQNATVQPTVTPIQQGPPGDPKQPFIHRQTATKVAAILLGSFPAEERNMTTLLTLAERLVAYYDHGLPQAETVEDLMNRAMPQGMDGPPPDPGQYTGDDDIPF